MERKKVEVREYNVEVFGFRYLGFRVEGLELRE
jgi:hypothetical protein